MKYILILLVIIIICSCDMVNRNNYAWSLHCSYDNNWRSTVIYCDSLQMKSSTKAIVWINGIPQTVFAEELRPQHLGNK